MATGAMRRPKKPLLTENSQVFTFTRRALVLGGAQGLMATALATILALGGGAGLLMLTGRRRAA